MRFPKLEFPEPYVRKFLEATLPLWQLLIRYVIRCYVGGCAWIVASLKLETTTSLVDRAYTLEKVPSVCKWWTICPKRIG